MATQHSIDFDTPAKELHRVEAPATSVEAAHAGDKTGDAAKVYGLIRISGAAGLTAKEAAMRMGKPLNAVSGRLSNLSRKGHIKPNGFRRDRSRAFVLSDLQLYCDCGTEISDEQADKQWGACDHCAKGIYE